MNHDLGSVCQASQHWDQGSVMAANGGSHSMAFASRELASPLPAETGVDYFSRLPTELVLHISTDLQVRDILALRATCKFFHQAINPARTSLANTILDRERERLADNIAAFNFAGRPVHEALKTYLDCFGFRSAKCTTYCAYKDPPSSQPTRIACDRIVSAFVAWYREQNPDYAGKTGVDLAESYVRWICGKIDTFTRYALGYVYEGAEDAELANEIFEVVSALPPGQNAISARDATRIYLDAMPRHVPIIQRGQTHSEVCRIRTRVDRIIIRRLQLPDLGQLPFMPHYVFWSESADLILRLTLRQAQHQREDLPLVFAALSERVEVSMADRHSGHPAESELVPNV
ncbi:hypothetical protein KC340_g8938 [Hortaea werneckii]|nr:hypothetical protein KC342_g9238 [Hortaea werneckii]KAI7095156.1 hypothetical protein KC339_g11176 [Hortaea werneckii]KAI7229256.1 hypothetical protein KC365_g8101 [Hortaea werneckii]KAI7315592.1 hypothetical protein KC340_g8938 [Hortaea werneckii]KAI7378735.1 hypothetical protein KC328_g13738 [Hortaea werneckii]